MPLSKKRMRERKQMDRMSNLTDSNVKPKLADWMAIDGITFHWRDQGVQPIPNRPDGSHR